MLSCAKSADRQAVPEDVRRECVTLPQARTCPVAGIDGSGGARQATRCGKRGPRIPACKATRASSQHPGAARASNCTATRASQLLQLASVRSAAMLANRVMVPARTASERSGKVQGSEQGTPWTRGRSTALLHPRDQQCQSSWTSGFFDDDAAALVSRITAAGSYSRPRAR